MNLYELEQAYLDILELDLEEEDLLLALQSLEGSIKDKANNIGKVLNSLDLEQATYKAEIDRLNVKKAKASKKYDSLKKYLSDSLKTLEIDKLECELFKISFRKSQTVEFDDKDIIPSEYKTSATVETINKNDLKKALKLNEIPGCHLEEHRKIQVK